MTNDQLASIFEEMADLLELQGENAFRVRAYRNGAKAIRDLDEPVSTILADGNRSLTDVPGVGSTLADKAVTLLATGSHPTLERLRQTVPSGLRIVMQVPGVGAKKAASLWHALNVIDLQSLREACESGRVREVSGFGAKSEQSILKGIPMLEQSQHRLRIDEAANLASRIRSFLLASTTIEECEFAGSLRRGKETVGDLDILVVSSHPDQAMDHLEQFPERTETIAKGDTKLSIRVGNGFQVDLRVVPRISWGAALQYFTGSKEHNVRLRSIAKQQGLRLNEYGVFGEGDDKNALAGATEEDVYRAIGLQWVPPETREDRFEFLDNQTVCVPDLLAFDALRGDLHMHSTDSDGENTIEEMAEAAMAIGLEYIAITDHSKRVSVARGLDDQRTLEQWARIDALRPHYHDRLILLKGIEVDILEDGELDLPDPVLQQGEYVTASIHFGQRQSKQQITDRLLGAIRNPFVTAISHPTGRLIGRRDPYEVDLAAIVQAAAEHGKILELNASPKRLDLNDLHCMIAKKAGVGIAINTDAHQATQIGAAHWGILQARRAGLRAQDVLNTLPRKAFLEKLAAIRRQALPAS